MAAMPVALLLLTLRTPGYGYFIDEFYYIACSKRLAFGYVDHPPVSPFLLAGIRALFGESIAAIRLTAFLATGATVFVGGLIVRRLGGGRGATVLAGLTTGFAPILLALGSFYSMNVFEPLLWTLTLWVILTIVQGGRERLWLAVGLLIGLAFENKHTIVLYVATLALGVLATDARRMVRSGWLWAGCGLAALVAAPNLAWQAANGWPSLEFYRNAQFLKNVTVPYSEALLMQFVVNNPAAAPVWIAGAVYLLAHRDARPLRFAGVAFVALLALQVISKSSRPDRIAGVFPFMFAAGAVAVETWLSQLRTRRPAAARTILAGWIVVILAVAAAVLPSILPLLPPDTTARYVAAIGMVQRAERGQSSSLPQLLADRTGWEKGVEAVARVYRALPPDDQAAAIIFAPSYGQAGALEFFGPRAGLPGRVIGKQNSYWHWSVGHTNSNVLIALDANPDDLRHLFREVWQAGVIPCPYCMTWRRDVPVWVGRGSIAPLDRFWPGQRTYM
jgi:4-amino-4-deoxy-L-arabinose transferase-like glycosyltransferase